MAELDLGRTAAESGLVHLTSSAIDWYATRAAGVVAYVLLTSVVAMGVLLAGRQPLRTPRFAIENVHRFLGLLTGVFVALHVATIAIDSFVPFSITQLVVPFTASYRPVWTGVGVVTAELLVALAVTNSLRRRLPHRAWRRLHYLSFLVWVGATVHGLGGGTDRGSTWLLAIFAGSVALVVGGTAMRVVRGRGLPFALGPRTLAAGAGVAALGLVVLASSFFASSPAPQANEQSGPLDEPLHGQLVVQNGPAYELLSVVGQSAGTAKLQVRIDLLAQGNAIVNTSLQVELSNGRTCTGTVDQVSNDGFSGSCAIDGLRRQVQATWSIDRAAATVEGELQMA